MSRLVIKFPTRNRPEKFKTVFSKYLSFLSGRHDVRFVVSMDEDDTTMNTPEIKDWFETQKKSADIKYCYGYSKSKIDACTTVDELAALYVYNDAEPPVRPLGEFPNPPSA